MAAFAVVDEDGDQGGGAFGAGLRRSCVEGLAVTLVAHLATGSGHEEGCAPQVGGQQTLTNSKPYNPKTYLNLNPITLHPNLNPKP